MSRGNYEYDDYEENFPNEAAFWERRLKTARSSKRGRKALGDLREALRLLPERRLVSGAMSTVNLETKVGGDEYTKKYAEEKVQQEGRGVCAVGAYIWYQKVKAGMTPERAWDSLPVLLDADSDLSDTARAGQDHGLTFTLGWMLADLNDEGFSHLTPEERYEHYMEWLDTELAKVPA